MLERITRREEADLFIAWMAISLSFAIIKIAPYGILGQIPRLDPVVVLIYFGIAFLTVGIGFIFHEMAHKFTAIRYGYWAEFRKDNSMLLIAIVLAALVGFVFAAPGATVIYTGSADGRGLSRSQNGIIAASGPVVNLFLCGIFAGVVLEQTFTFTIQSPHHHRHFRHPDQCNDCSVQPASDQYPRWEKSHGLETLRFFAVLIIAAFGILLGSFYLL